MESNGSLHDAESEIVSLKEKVGLLEMSIVLLSQRNKFEMEKKVESLKCERDTLKYEKIQALNNEMFKEIHLMDCINKSEEECS